MQGSHRHLAATLLFLLAGASASAGPLAFPLQQTNSGNYYIHATLSGTVETDMLLDTGSGYVSLSAGTFKQLKSDSGTRFQRHITGIMANGRAVSVPVYSIARLDLGTDCVLHDIEVAVFSGASRDILGLNALRRLQPFTFAMEPPRLTGSQCR